MMFKINTSKLQSSTQYRHVGDLEKAAHFIKGRCKGGGGSIHVYSHFWLIRLFCNPAKMSLGPMGAD